MFMTAFNGLCMSLADSVPGVSGGTIAFILGLVTLAGLELLKIKILETSAPDLLNQTRGVVNES